MSSLFLSLVSVAGSINPVFANSIQRINTRQPCANGASKAVYAYPKCIHTIRRQPEQQSKVMGVKEWFMLEIDRIVKCTFDIPGPVVPGFCVHIQVLLAQLDAPARYGTAEHNRAVSLCVHQRELL